MKFKDKKISKYDLTKVYIIPHLIIRDLCGQGKPKKLSLDDERLLQDLINRAKEKGLNYEQFNELLLLLNQDRIGRGFFKFFFEKDKISLDDLKEGIIKFRGYAMLRFGNFRFAYKQLIQKSENEIKEKLWPYSREPSEVVKECKNRPQKMLEIKEIERDKTWYLGEVSGTKLERQVKALDEERQKAQRGKSSYNEDELLQFGKNLGKMGGHAVEVQKKAFKNTDIYLTWDYMDLYVATSMRNKWEFEETFDFIKEVLSIPLEDLEGSNLGKLNLRYFDPTQCKCKNSRDKGLIEGLMLKRALCTIYLAQESDTMGKDSELAATLAQSKPVIAYIPKYDPKKYARKIREYPLDFFKKRLLILDAEEILDDPDCMKKIREKVTDFENKIGDFLNRLDDHREDQPFSLWIEKETEFKQNYQDFSEICNILAIAECYNFDRRAKLLKERHPLSMQVDLQDGVANGVLVVRSAKECARLLRKILANSIEFAIKHRKEGYTILEESISKSPFRVVTDYERLTNSFWNFWG